MSNDSAHGRAVGTHPGPEENIADGRPGRKTIPTRCVLEAVLGILNTGAQWHMLPQSYPNYKTVHRRFQTWCRDEVLRRVLTDVANELRDKGALNEEECFIDATFVMAKGGGSEIGATKRGKGMKIMAIVDRHGLPLSVSTHAANHHEVRLLQLCFDFYMIEAKPENLIGDRAYDSDPLDAELRKDGIEMIAPHRSNRSKSPTQDRRRLSRYMGRWLSRLASSTSFSIARWVSRASVGCAIAFSCTVVSIATRSRSLVSIAPVRWATERLSCNSATICSSPSRWRQRVSDERSNGSSCRNTTSPQKYWKYGFSTHRSHSASSERLCICLRMNSPAPSRVGNGGCPGPTRHTELKRPARKSQSISPARRTRGGGRGE